ncbi:MAG: NUDIX domain-containing protein [Gammaproteobacteria bacterium]
MEEIFDVVDAQDNVVGCAPRALVHARGLRHRASHVLVEDRAGRIYLQQRAMTKDCSAGLWDTSAAGHLDRGEAYESAARRELQEELGVIAAGPLRRLAKLAAGEDTGNEFVEVFHVVVEGEVRPDPTEIAAGGWFERAQIDAWLAREPRGFTTTFHRIWEIFERDSAR